MEQEVQVRRAQATGLRERANELQSEARQKDSNALALSQEEARAKSQTMWPEKLPLGSSTVLSRPIGYRAETFMKAVEWAGREGEVWEGIIAFLFAQDL